MVKEVVELVRNYHLIVLHGFLDQYPLVRP